MSDDRLSDEELGVLFRDAHRERPIPSSDWMTRVSEDAERELAFMTWTPSEPLWSQVANLLGGWRGFGGMAIASAAGLWIGIAPPALLGDPVGTALGTSEAVDVFSATPFEFAGLLEEG